MADFFDLIWLISRPTNKALRHWNFGASASSGFSHINTASKWGRQRIFRCFSVFPVLAFWQFYDRHWGAGRREKLLPGEVLKIYELRPAPIAPPWPTLFNFISLRQSWKEILQVFGSQEFIVCQLRNLFVAVNLQFFRRCQVAQPKHPHVRVLQVRFPFDFYFVSKLQLFGNCFYSTTKTLKGRRRASAAAVGWLRWGWRRWGAENGHRSSKGKCQK